MKGSERKVERKIFEEIHEGRVKIDRKTRNESNTELREWSAGGSFMSVRQSSRKQSGRTSIIRRLKDGAQDQSSVPGEPLRPRHHSDVVVLASRSSVNHRGG